MARRRRHTAMWIAVLVLVISAGLVAVLVASPPAQITEAQSALLGRPAPTIAGATVDGSAFRMPENPGHYVVVNFFASWCIPCQEEGPELVAFQFQHLQSDNASVVSVVFNDTSSYAKEYQARIGATWPTMADPNGTIALNYGVRGDPTSFIIDPEGRVAWSTVGGVTALGLNNVIRRLGAEGYGG